MTVTLSQIFYATVQPNASGPTFTIGSKTVPITQSVTDAKADTITLANNATFVLFDRGAAGNYSQGDFLVVLPHASGFLLELKSDAALPNYTLLALASGFPFCLPDLVMYRDYGTIGGTAYTQFTSGTVAEVDTVTVKNTNGASQQISYFIAKA